MVTLQCTQCNMNFEAKRKDTQYCPTCKAKRRSLQVMISRKKRFPNVELGVGSGNYSGNHGTTHGSYTTGISIYRKLIPTKCCAICNSKKFLCVHHKDENRRNNEPSNLICVCKSCHQKIHVQRDAITGRYSCKSNTEVSN